MSIDTMEIVSWQPGMPPLGPQRLTEEEAARSEHGTPPATPAPDPAEWRSALLRVDGTGRCQAGYDVRTLDGVKQYRAWSQTDDNRITWGIFAAWDVADMDRVDAYLPTDRATRDRMAKVAQMARQEMAYYNAALVGDALPRAAASDMVTMVSDLLGQAIEKIRAEDAEAERVKRQVDYDIACMELARRVEHGRALLAAQEAAAAPHRIAVEGQAIVTNAPPVKPKRSHHKKRPAIEVPA